MAYIIGLVLAISLLVFTFGTDVNSLVSALLKNPAEKLSDVLKNKTMEFAFPKSQEELTIEDLQSQLGTIEKLFSDGEKAIMSSKDVPQSVKKSFQESAKVLGASQQAIQKLQSMTQQNDNLATAVIKKVFNLESSNPEPTSIPPGCNLVCK